MVASSWQEDSVVSAYRIAQNGQLWCVHTPATGRAIVSSTDKAQLIAWTRQFLAADHDGNRDVFDANGQLEVSYSYASGVETRQVR